MRSDLGTIVAGQDETGSKKGVSLPAGAAFITHEYDEGIAIQEIIVAAAIPIVATKRPSRRTASTSGS